MAKMPNFDKVRYLPPASLLPYASNARVHSKKQIRKIADSIKQFGFTNPVLISDGGQIIAGHGRVEAAKLLGLKTVPTLDVSHLSAAERRAYILADNKLAESGNWDKDTLAIEFQALVELNFDVELTGFSVAEIGLTLGETCKSSSNGAPHAPADNIPPATGDPISCTGDVWHLGRHRLICGDARIANDYACLLGADRADLIFTDPPYNDPEHNGGVSGDALTLFLTESLGAAAKMCQESAIAFVCTDWPYMGELSAAGKTVFSELKNVCIWKKTNADLGHDLGRDSSRDSSGDSSRDSSRDLDGFYRPKHEFIFVFQVAPTPHAKSWGLGITKRHRTNVWNYAGINSATASRSDEHARRQHFAIDPASHPAMRTTLKPVALVADAIRDCTKRGAIVLDAFGGTGTTLIAAEACGRAARLIERDPICCDTIVRRFENLTGKQALLGPKGLSFEEAGHNRLPSAIEGVPT